MQKWSQHNAAEGRLHIDPLTKITHTHKTKKQKEEKMWEKILVAWKFLQKLPVDVQISAGEDHTPLDTWCFGGLSSFFLGFEHWRLGTGPMDMARLIQGKWSVSNNLVHLWPLISGRQAKWYAPRKTGVKWYAPPKCSSEDRGIFSVTHTGTHLQAHNIFLLSGITWSWNLKISLHCKTTLVNKNIIWMELHLRKGRCGQLSGQSWYDPPCSFSLDCIPCLLNQRGRWKDTGSGGEVSQY